LSKQALQNITAIIYDRRGRVISIGQNSYVKTHPMQAYHAKKVGEPYKQYLHAEVHAIVKCPDISKAHRIFVSRWNKNGDTMNAAPCPICMSAIKSTPIKVIEHT
jgi:tRNA(Arg) A34 adenosine deaminase TadA